MGKIKGWTKFTGHDAWHGKSLRRVVQVTPSYSGLGKWAMSVHGMDEPGEVNYQGLQYARYFDTKQEAIDYARDYMRSNP